MTNVEDTFYIIGSSVGPHPYPMLVRDFQSVIGTETKKQFTDMTNKKLPDRTIQYSNPKQPATYCRNVGKRRRWEFAIKNNQNENKILSENVRPGKYYPPTPEFKEEYIKSKNRN